LAKSNIKAAGLDSIFTVVHSNFSQDKDVLGSLDIKNIDGALLDLGVSSMQLDQKERGFSFADRSQMLDMRMDRTKIGKASDILNNYSQTELSRILFQYGEEKFANKIAAQIIETRKHKKFVTIGDLLDVLSHAIPLKIQKTSRIHFATKTFQALRIEVNGELKILEKSIKDIAGALRPGSRLAVISFHSLEDRIVKNVFAHLSNPCKCPKEIPICVCGEKPTVLVLTKKPIVADDSEILENPRSRSAKLRIIEKI
jgi:16S rRNA (cytosine1402-N4)-methyltransferase